MRGRKRCAAARPNPKGAIPHEQPAAIVGSNIKRVVPFHWDLDKTRKLETHMVFPASYIDIKIARCSGFDSRYMVKVGKQAPPLAFAIAVIQSIYKVRCSGCRIHLNMKQGRIRNLPPWQARPFILYL